MPEMNCLVCDFPVTDSGDELCEDCFIAALFESFERGAGGDRTCLASEGSKRPKSRMAPTGPIVKKTVENKTGQGIK